MAAYNAEFEADERNKPAKKAAPQARSFNRLADIYFNSPAFIDLRPNTKRGYKSNLGTFLTKYGHLPVDRVEFEHLSAIMAEMSATPSAANNILKRLRTLFVLAKRLKWISSDPSAGIKRFREGEYHTWTTDEIKTFEDRWPSGSKERLAFSLHLYTGQRKSDIVRMPWPKDGLISVKQAKAKDHEPPLSIPVDKKLQIELDQHKREHLLILITKYGKPYSPNGYGNWFHEICMKAGLPERCASHGLRKAAATHLAEAGCTVHEIMAITGHKTISEVERYTRQVDQKRLAEEAQKKRTENR